MSERNHAKAELQLLIKLNNIKSYTRNEAEFTEVMSISNQFYFSFVQRSRNFSNDDWLESFNVTIGNKLVDVPGRVLKTPGILYGEVGVEPGYFLSNLCRSNRLRKLFKLIRNGELGVLIQLKFCEIPQASFLIAFRFYHLTWAASF